MKTKLIILAVIAAVLGGTGYYYKNYSTYEWRMYTNDEYGFQFSYPDQFIVRSGERVDGCGLPYAYIEIVNEETNLLLAFLTPVSDCADGVAPLANRKSLGSLVIKHSEVSKSFDDDTPTRKLHYEFSVDDTEWLVFHHDVRTEETLDQILASLRHL